MEALSFCAYLVKKGFSIKEIKGVLDNPVVRIPAANGEIMENYLFSITANDSFQSAADKFAKIQSQLCCF